MRGISWLAAEPVSFSRRTLRQGVSKYKRDCLSQIYVLRMRGCKVVNTRNRPLFSVPGDILVLVYGTGWVDRNAGRIMSMKNPNDLIENRTGKLPACWLSVSTNSAKLKCSYMLHVLPVVYTHLLVSKRGLLTRKPKTWIWFPSSA